MFALNVGLLITSFCLVAYRRSEYSMPDFLETIRSAIVTMLLASTLWVLLYATGVLFDIPRVEELIGFVMLFITLIMFLDME